MYTHDADRIATRMPPSVGRVRISRACGYSPAHSAHPWYTTLRGGRSSWVCEYPDPVRGRPLHTWLTAAGRTQLVPAVQTRPHTGDMPTRRPLLYPPGRAIRGSPIAMKRHGNRMALVTKIQKSLPPATPAPLPRRGGGRQGGFWAYQRNNHSPLAFSKSPRPAAIKGLNAWG